MSRKSDIEALADEMRKYDSTPEAIEIELRMSFAALLLHALRDRLVAKGSGYACWHCGISPQPDLKR